MTFKRNKILFMALKDVFLIRLDSSGIMHWINAVIPRFLSNNLGLMIFVSSLSILLSLLYALGSLKPGVSIIVRLPVVPAFTTPVTDS